MIIQGTNIPIKVTFESSVDSYKNIAATLWIQGKLAKSWMRDKGEMSVEGTTVTLPVDEDETRKFAKGTAVIEVKGLNIMDEVVFWEEAEIEVVSRRDKNIELID